MLKVIVKKKKNPNRSRDYSVNTKAAADPSRGEREGRKERKIGLRSSCPLLATARGTLLKEGRDKRKKICLG